MPTRNYRSRKASRGKDAVVIVSTSGCDRPASAIRQGLTGAAFVEAMQQARRLGLRLKPLRYYPDFSPPVTLAEDDR